jgi:hypothetical protein
MPYFWCESISEVQKTDCAGFMDFCLPYCYVLRYVRIGRLEVKLVRQDCIEEFL